jgi:hypothetical protein
MMPVIKNIAIDIFSVFTPTIIVVLLIYVFIIAKEKIK